MNNTSQQPNRPRAAVILAAGKGTRMGGDMPKVLHEVAGKPMLHWVAQACREAGAAPLIVVVGYRSELVREALAGQDDIVFVEQTEQLGTGHAVEVCRDSLADLGGDAFVLAGDGPLIRARTLCEMVEIHARSQASATLATAVLDDATGYGRIVRDEQDRFASIVEHKNASDAQLAIHEVYPSYAIFDVYDLLDMLEILPRDAVSGEFYLTEVPAMLRSNGKQVEIVPGVPAEDILSINTPAQLADVDAILQNRLHMEATT
ncbi:MAG: NTP transferase domain-containing protein [Phycisphaerales bacterium]|jgi:bifunctional UDP-N-acetylglucosamine pyrophosphorylase / glucosamine-1-phosphate N-acetyltransferase|nr:NTP transferase domain-containing protein [Phycisphaerales bacterium]